MSGRAKNTTGGTGATERRGRARRRAVTAVAVGLPIALLGAAVVASSHDEGAEAAPVGAGFTVTTADLSFILDQIDIAEAHTASIFEFGGPDVDPCSLQTLRPDQVPGPLVSYGLRTVSGVCNNLQPGRSGFGAADRLFPRLAAPDFVTAEAWPAATFGPASPGQPTATSYAQGSRIVIDSEPRLISNLIVDQTDANPAAISVAGNPSRSQGVEGVVPCVDEEADPPMPLGCVPHGSTLFIPNITTDVGLSPPFNSLMTIFGQFFDHGLDKINNGGNGSVFIPLRADDPLVVDGPDHVPGTGDEVPPHLRFMVLTRGTWSPGPDGLSGTADDVHEADNSDSPYVDLSQVYSSHESHQVVLREYANDAFGHPQPTGKMLGNASGTLATWADVKTQAATMLGLQFVDTDVADIPMIAADLYGNFIPGANGLPQWVTDQGVIEGSLTQPVPADGVLADGTPYHARRISTAFLNDIAHHAAPGLVDHDGNPGTPKQPAVADADPGTTDDLDPATYDDEMLDAHFIAGDGRVNENIALSAIHTVFEKEHNRLVDDIKRVLTSDASPLGAATLAGYSDANTIDGWDGDRLFQAARFITEMEYQHLVFEEFGRKIQPLINPFTVYHDDVDAAITAEFAHAVYRFGHSMLNETIPRLNEDGTRNDIALLDGFLDPTEFLNGGPAGPLTAEQATGAIIMGLSDQTGNEIDEFVTETLRNNLLGLPLDLATLNLARARSEGIPRLNEFRRQMYVATAQSDLQPYTDWIDFGLQLKHPESLVNFVAAYGQHPTIVAEDTIVGRRAAAQLLVDPPFATDPAAIPQDAADFMFSMGSWEGIETGLNLVDLWVGGLAERTNLIGGLLGSTFNFVFEQQMTDLQNGDRFYYLLRTPGMNLRSQLEGNSFAELVMRNTTAHTLKADSFATADCKFELAHLSSPAPSGSAVTGVGSVGDDPSSECNENRLLIRMGDGTWRYRATNTVDPAGINGQSVYNGTAGADKVFGGVDNDTFLGNEGNDRIEGNDGADVALGGEGSDIITDLAGDDVLKGGPDSDVIDAGVGLDIVMGGDGNDVTNGGANDNETFGGPGGDFIIDGRGNGIVFGDTGSDWIEGGDGQELLCGDSCAPFFDDPTEPGHDVLIGQNGEEDYDAEGGDDILNADPGIERNAGAGGYDFVSHQYDPVPADADLNRQLVAVAPPVDVLRDRFQEVEGLSGGSRDDILRGDDVIPAQGGGGGFAGCDVLDQAGLDRIAGLDDIVPPLDTPLADVLLDATARNCPLSGELVWGAGNILLGGAGSDVLEGNGADDVIDGDQALQVRISVRGGVPGTAEHLDEIGTTTLIESPYLAGSTRTLQTDLFAGLVHPDQLVITRELVTSTSVDDLDIALFCDSSINYDVSFGVNDVGLPFVRVAHLNPQGGGGGGGGRNRCDDGVDTLYHVEFLQFADEFRDVTPVLAVPTADLSTVAVAFPTRAVAAAEVVETVTLTNNGTSDLNVAGLAVGGADASSFTATTDCTVVVAGSSCTVSVGFAPASAGPLSAVVDVLHDAPTGVSTITLDGVGVVNAVPTGAVSISDASPTEATSLLADTATVADADGLGAVAPDVQWQQGAVGGGVTFTDIPGATSPTFVPAQAQVNRRLRAVVRFTDDHGTDETVASTPTDVVGDFINDGNGGSTLTGTAGADLVLGNGGADNVAANGGDDDVTGGAGNDGINTGGGNDIVRFVGGAEGFDTVTGGADVDAIVASPGATIGLAGVTGVETITGSGATPIVGNAANNTFTFTGVVLSGIASIDGGGGADAITGSAAGDVILGGAGADVLNGLGGDDTITGGAGNDSLNGGLGANRFVFAAGFGQDTITGFDVSGGVGAQDHLDVSALGITAANFAANVRITQVGTAVRVQIGVNRITLANRTAATVTIADFVLAA